MTFAGVVLAGGRSRRMGTDKALLDIDGLPLAARLRAVLVTAGATQTLSIGGDLPALAGLGFDARADQWPGEGPLGGLITGLEAAATPSVVVLACDLPSIDAATLRTLVTQLEASSGDAVVPLVEGHLQPLAAAYRTTVRALLRTEFERGKRSMHEALAMLAVETVTWPSGPAAFIDLDTPGDLAAYRRAGVADGRLGL